MPTLNDLLQTVTDKKSFLLFVEAVIEDRKKATNGVITNGWESETIEQYLEAATAWTKDSETSFSSENPWRNFAEFLYMGKLYE